MEVFRIKILKVPTDLQNNFAIEQPEITMENTYVSFLNAMLNTSCQYDPQIVNICETVRYFFFINKLHFIFI